MGTPPNTSETFWQKVDKDGECWLWQGATDRKGYGRIRFQGRVLKTHRLAFELSNGPIPDGLLILHSCDNPRCVRPTHLRMGTHADNMSDRTERRRYAGAEDVTCPNGHLWMAETERDYGSGRQCLRCSRQRAEVAYWKSQTEALAAKIERVEALATECEGQHGQCWNSIFGQRIRAALADPKEES